MKFKFESIKNLWVFKLITDFLQKNYFLVGLLIFAIINLFILNGLSDRTKELELALNKTGSDVETVKASLKEHEETTNALFFNTSTTQKKISDENFDLTKALNQLLNQVSSTDEYFKKKIDTNYAIIIQAMDKLGNGIHAIQDQDENIKFIIQKLDAQSKTIPSTAEKHVETITLK